MEVSLRVHQLVRTCGKVFRDGTASFHSVVGCWWRRRGIQGGVYNVWFNGRQYSHRRVTAVWNEPTLGGSGRRASGQHA